MKYGYMNFFEIEKCGLYKVGSETVYGYSIDETFDLITDWLSTRAFVDTIPWDPSVSKTGKAKCYCKDFYKDEKNGDFLLVLWKSDTESSGTIWGAEEDATVGSGDVVKHSNNYKGKKVVWGRPSYYWIIPEEKTVVSIKFDNSVCDSDLFQTFVISCINNRVKSDRKRKERTEGGQTRFVFDDGSEEGRYSFRFSMKLRTLNTTNVKLQRLAQDITHVVYRETINVNTPDERAELVKFFSKKWPLFSAKAGSRKRKIEIVVEAKPTISELRKIIEENVIENRNRGGWDNLGFIGKDKNTTWVDTYRLNGRIVIKDLSGGVFPSTYLYNVLEKARFDFLNEIKENDVSLPLNEDQNVQYVGAL